MNTPGSVIKEGRTHMLTNSFTLLHENVRTNGANGNSLELRATSIKGMMRYFWRTVQPAALTISEIREKEGRLFGTLTGLLKRHQSLFILKR